MEISQKFVAFSEYMNFRILIFIWYFIADEASNKSNGGPVAADTLQLKNMLNGDATKMKETKTTKLSSILTKKMKFSCQMLKQRPVTRSKTFTTV